MNFQFSKSPYNDKGQKELILRTYINIIDLFDEKAKMTLRYSNQGKHLKELNIIMKNCKRESKILDIGGGMGINLLCISKIYNSCELYLIDKFEEYFERDRLGNSENPMGDGGLGLTMMKNNRISTINQDVFADPKLPFNSGYFDLITCFDVIEHFPGSPIELFNDVRRILKPGGKFLLGGPNLSSFKNRAKMLLGEHPYISFDRWIYDKCYYSHYREYNASEYQKLINSAGFSLDSMIMSSEPLATAMKYGFLKGNRSISIKFLLNIDYLFERIYPNCSGSLYCVCSSSVPSVNLH